MTEEEQKAVFKEGLYHMNEAVWKFMQLKTNYMAGWLEGVLSHLVTSIEVDLDEDDE